LRLRIRAPPTPSLTLCQLRTLRRRRYNRSVFLLRGVDFKYYWSQTSDKICTPAPSPPRSSRFAPYSMQGGVDRGYALALCSLSRSVRSRASGPEFDSRLSTLAAPRYSLNEGACDFQFYKYESGAMNKCRQWWILSFPVLKLLATPACSGYH
jgi:hypothetical protein